MQKFKGDMPLLELAIAQRMVSNRLDVTTWTSRADRCERMVRAAIAFVGVEGIKFGANGSSRVEL